MLETVVDAGLAGANLNDLKCFVELPPHMTEFLCEEGYLSSVLSEQRGIMRLRVRCEAVIRSESLPSYAPFQWKEVKIYMKDLSRTGVGILSHFQHWPGEYFWLFLMGRRLLVNVVRCRKLGPRCFEVGGEVISIITNSE